MNQNLERWKMQNDLSYFIETISNKKLHWYQKLILSNLRMKPDLNIIEDYKPTEFQSNHKQTYLSQFLSLKCCGDVLNIVNPLGNSAHKEITESIGIINHLRNIVLKKPGKYMLYDLMAGNALTSIIAAHLLPIKGAIAIDKRERNRQWDKCRNFNYIFEDIYNIQPEFFDEDSIIISMHPCKDLAWRVIELFNKSKAKYLILCPCCEAGLSGNYQLICDQIGKSMVWCLELAVACKGQLFKDNKIISPKNIIIVAEKKNGGN